MSIGGKALRLSVRATLLFAFCAAVVAQAETTNLDYEVDLGGGHSDNILRTPANERSEDIASAGLQFSFDEHSKKIQADVIGDFAYYDYRDDTFDSEVIGNLSGGVLFSLVPEHFQWMASDNFGQVLTDPFAPATPENSENINYFTTGPDVYFDLGSVTQLRLGGRYTDTRYEDSPLDSRGASVQLGLARLLSRATSVSLNVRALKETYDENALNGDYKQNDAFVSFEAQGARTNLSLDLGYSELDRDASTDKEGGLLFRLDVRRRISGYSVVTLDAGEEFSSSGSAFAAAQSFGGVDLNATPGRQTVQPFTNKYASLGWSFDRNRTAFSVAGSYSERSYEDDPTLDQTFKVFSVQLSRELSQRTSLGLTAVRTSAQFEQSGGDYDETTAGLNLSWRLTQRVTVRVSYDYFDRSSDSPLSEYTENRYWLTVGYGRGVPRASPVAPTFAIDSAATGT